MSLPISRATADQYSKVLLDQLAAEKKRLQGFDDCVVFVDATGAVTCRLSDDTWTVPGLSTHWRWSASGEDGCTLYPQAKHLMFHVLYHPEFLQLSLSTLGQYYYGLRVLARACDRVGLRTIGTFFADDRAAFRVVEDMKENQGFVVFLHIGPGLFNAFHRFGEGVVGFRTRRAGTYKRLRALLQDLNRRSYQHPVIPWRIYKCFLVEISGRVRSCLNRLDDPAWVSIIRFHVFENPRERRKFPSETVKYIKREHPKFAERINNFHKLLGELGMMQQVARIGLLAYTGCRRSETSAMRPMEPEQVDESTFLIHGFTTKSVRGRVYWVTNEHGANALRLAMNVRAVVSRGLDLDSAPALPLLPQLHNFPNNVMRSRRGDIRGTERRDRTPMNDAIRRIGLAIPAIEDADYAFLSQLSRDSRIDLDKFAPGTAFPFSPHQLRRSLAYFVMRVGGIEIGALRRQFKHLLAGMTRYYTSGVVSAEPESAMTISDLLSKERLLEIDERLRRHLASYTDLRGPMGTSAKRDIESASEEGRQRIIESTRERMLKRVRQGEINYMETPLGACLSADPCIPRARAEVSACLRCKSAVLELPKVEKTYRLLRDSEHPFLAAQAEHFSHFLTGSDEAPYESEDSHDA